MSSNNSSPQYFLQRNWSAFYAPGQEIRDYLDSVVDKYKLRPYIKLHHRVTRAEYDEATGKWHLTIRRPKNEASLTGTSWDWKTDFEEIEDTADVLFGGLGGLSRWSWPEIEGLENFKGRVIHSAQWETGERGADGPEWEESVKDWGDKRVGVIGVVSVYNVAVAMIVLIKLSVFRGRLQSRLCPPFSHESNIW
jgi:cation diffusion facilitator CzcD-associated flavoprotein CzcO